MKHRWLLVASLLGILAFPQPVWANAGTPLMWAGPIHLIFGNALIGLGEGLLLAWLFSVPKGKSVLLMIVANYVSAWMGALFISGAMASAVPMDLNNGWMWFWVMVVVTYCMTVVLEWPFIARCFRGARGRLSRSLRASLVVQSASYILLFAWYWEASGTSLYTEMEVVSPADLSLPGSVLVYYIDPAGGAVHERPLVGGEAREVLKLGSTGKDDRLLVRESAADSSRWDLVARLETRDHDNPSFVPVKTNLHLEAAPDWKSTHSKPPQYEGTWFNFGVASKLGSAKSSRWEFRTGFWPIEGLEASSTATGEPVRFSYETPFGAWTVRNAVHLPSDKVLFQLGDDQICAFDPVTRRVALLWHGRGPVAVMEKANLEQDGGPASGSRPIRAETEPRPSTEASLR